MQYHQHSAIFGNHQHTISTAYTVNLYPEVEIKVNDKGNYQAYFKMIDGKWGSVDLPFLNRHESIGWYVTNLSPEQLEAAAKIFYDRWAFVSGDPWEKQLYQTCEEELKQRREASPYALHTHDLPSHSHGGHLTMSNDGAHTHNFDHRHPTTFFTRMPWQIPAS